jgi:hypothetical protein
MTPLRQRMIDDMQLRHLAASTQRQYIAYVAAFAKYFKSPPGHRFRRLPSQAREWKT